MADYQEKIASAWKTLHSATEQRTSKARLKRLREIAIIVGAGVSNRKCEKGRKDNKGFPDWPTLTKNLTSAAGLDEPAIAKYTFPTQMRLARKLFEESHPEEQWNELVRRIMYENFPTKITKKQRQDYKTLKRTKNPDLMDYIVNNYPTAAGIVNLCTRMVTEKRSLRKYFVANPRVGAILTYNLDGLLQLYDRARHGSPRILRSVERASKDRYLGKINLYHLHGYLLPERGKAKDEAADRLVLTEEEYNDWTDDPYSFANSSILWALREFVCIFVGCSMTDELMRRSLHRSLKQREKALKDEGKVESKRMKQRHFAVVKWNENDAVNRPRERDLATLGVNPLWVEDFGPADLARRLEDLARKLEEQESELAQVQAEARQEQSPHNSI